jgi:PEP-CTERM motif-containing protein
VSLSNDEGFSLGSDGIGSLFWGGGQIGDTRSLDGDFTFAVNGPSGARIDGNSYNPFLSGRLVFTSTPFVLPPPTNGAGSFQTPFTLSGRVQGYSSINRTPDSLLFDIDLTGSGTTTSTIRYIEGVGYAPIFVNATYRFAPADVAATPEPASMLLLGTGVAGLVMRQRRRGQA